MSPVETEINMKRSVRRKRTVDKKTLKQVVRFFWTTEKLYKINLIYYFPFSGKLSRWKSFEKTRYS